MEDLREEASGHGGARCLHPDESKSVGSQRTRELICRSLVDCKKCKQRFRGDKLLEEKLGVEAAAILKLEQVQKMLMAENIPCPACGKVNWTEAKRFNLMFKTHQGVVEEEAALVYLRPETAQGIFVNFKNILDTTRLRLPFGVGQIGKAFRNEITPGTSPSAPESSNRWKSSISSIPRTTRKGFLNPGRTRSGTGIRTSGISDKKLRVREHSRDELSHYSSRTIDIEYEFPWGFGELFGLADRGDFDLKQHETFSGQDLKYTDPDDPTKKFIPHVIEPSFGCDRTVLTFLLEAYAEEPLPNGESRTVMKFDKRLAPIDVAILPLSKGTSHPKGRRVVQFHCS